MQRILLLCLLLCWGSRVFAQYNELGVFLGGANPITDIGKATHMNPNKLAWGLFYKRNMHERYALRVHFKSITLTDTDELSAIEARQKRGYSFKNEIQEMAFGVEYNFLAFDQHRVFDYLFSPYIFTGLVYFRQDNLSFPLLTQEEKKPSKVKKEPLKQAIKDGRTAAWALPFSVGVKTRLGYTRVLMGAEMGIRYTFSNNIDGSFSKQEQLRFGNIHTNDWYFVAGFYLTYSFGKKACLCFN